MKVLKFFWIRDVPLDFQVGVRSFQEKKLPWPWGQKKIACPPPPPGGWEEKKSPLSPGGQFLKFSEKTPSWRWQKKSTPVKQKKKKKPYPDKTSYPSGNLMVHLLFRVKSSVGKIVRRRYKKDMSHFYGKK